MTSAAMANLSSSGFLSPDAAAHGHNNGNNNHATQYAVGDANFNAALASMFPSDPSDPFISSDAAQHHDAAASGPSSRASPSALGRSLTLDSGAQSHGMAAVPPMRSNSTSELDAAGRPQYATPTQDRKFGSNSNDHSRGGATGGGGSSSSNANAAGAGFFSSPLAASPTDERSSPFGDQSSQSQTPSMQSGPHASLGQQMNQMMAQRGGIPNRSDSMQSGGVPGGFTPMKQDDPSSSSQQHSGTYPFDASESSPADRSQVESDAAAEKRQSSRFVYKLMRMVTDAESQHLISFNPSGTSVVVTNFDDFAKEVLPKHFKHSNFSSFIRQLNMYGFYKVNKTPRGQRNSADSQIWEFSHPKFIRGRYDLLDEIRRKALDTDQSRVDARADLQFNVSMGQFHIRQLLEEMQWRIDHTAEENRQLREFSLQMHSALVNVVDFLKASSGGQLPFDVQLPMLDMMPSPMVNSPYAPGSAWGTAGPQNPLHPFNQQQQQQQPGQAPTQQPVYQQDRQQQQQLVFGPGSSTPQGQRERPSIFVTEPGFAGPLSDPRGPQAAIPPHSPHDAGGAFSMSSFQGVSPLGSRRVSGTSSTLEWPEFGGYAAGNGGPMSGGGGPALEFSPQQQQQMHEAAVRGAIANMPRRSLSNRAGLAIDTGVPMPDGSEPSPLSTAHSGNLTPGGSVLSMPASASGNNPGLGVMGTANLGMQHHQQQHQVHAHSQHSGLLTAAVNTPLPPSPALSGYVGGGGGDESPFAYNAMSAAATGRFPSMHQLNGGQSGFPGFNSQQHQQQQDMSNDSFTHSTSPMIGGGDATFTLPMTSGDGEDGSGGLHQLDGSRPNSKAMRTPMKRTASNSAEAAAHAAAEARAAAGVGGVLDTPTAAAAAAANAKRKVPV